MHGCVVGGDGGYIGGVEGREDGGVVCGEEGGVGGEGGDVGDVVGGAPGLSVVGNLRFMKNLL